MIHTINDLVGTLLIQAHMPHSFWVETLNTAVQTLNILLSSSIQNFIPFTRLHNLPVTYSHLRVFGYLCYPNTLPTSPHKLAPRSTACIFLGYPSNHRGYRCLEISSRKIIISKHVTFVEDVFSFSTFPSPPSPPPPTLFLPPPLAPPSLLTFPTVGIPPPPAQHVAPVPTNHHTMTTQSKSGISKARPSPICLHTDSISPLPLSHV